jgi:hypothetical protein
MHCNKQRILKDRLAAVSSKSDQLLLLGGCETVLGVLFTPLREIADEP